MLTGRVQRLSALRGGASFGDIDFYDPSHLNMSGARRLTDALASRLR